MSFAGLKLLPAIQVIYHSSTQIQFWNSAIDNLIKDFVSSDGIDNQTYDAPISMKINKFERLELTNIFYAYPSTNQYSLKNIGFSISENDSLAVVGRSGSGKSTLIDVLLGLVKPHRGKILINNNDLNERNLKSWQNKIGYVPQDIYFLIVQYMKI